MLALHLLLLSAVSALTVSPERPNVLWLTSEDNGPQLGCYGDSYADTPHLDAFAARSTRVLHCWSNAPVCAPARTTIITGLYPTSTGAEHMRSMVALPDGFRMFPSILRDAGYYCANRSKEDYNHEKPERVWDDSSGKAHWKNRAEGQPFFAVINFTVSHESQLRKRPHEAKHDPAAAPVPPYHPDTPEVRRDWAQYYDKVTEMDAQVGARLEELEAAGLDDDTIVFYFGDHGSGMPRSKRWPYDSGLRVPLIVHVPEKWRHLAPDFGDAGGVSRRLVSFVDLAPTMLSLAGLEAPEEYQGGAFLGPFAAPAPNHMFGFRGRMDERTDLVRSVRNERYVYIRNYMPHRIQGEYLDYMFQTPTTRVWRERFDAGELDEVQSRFWRPKPTEELYDLEADPHEVVNLVGSSEHWSAIRELRRALREWIHESRDVGFIPEAEMHERARGSTPYEVGRDAETPLDAILAAAGRANSRWPFEIDKVRGDLQHDDAAVRTWALIGLLRRGGEAVRMWAEYPRAALDDPSASVRIAAAEALACHGVGDDVHAALDVLVREADVTKVGLYSAVAALQALDHVPELPENVRVRVLALPQKHEDVPRRLGNYVGRLLDRIGRE